jgi:hypothetical protein
VQHKSWIGLVTRPISTSRGLSPSLMKCYDNRQLHHKCKPVYLGGEINGRHRYLCKRALFRECQSTRNDKDAQ